MEEKPFRLTPWCFGLALLLSFVPGRAFADSFGVDIEGTCYPGPQTMYSASAPGATSLTGPSGISTLPCAGTSSANLVTGTLSATASVSAGNSAVAEADLYDTLTFSGVPVGGGTATLTLPLEGSVSGFAYATGYLDVYGPEFPTSQGLIASNSGSVGTSESGYSGPPSMVTLSWQIFNGDTEQLYAQLVADVGSSSDGGTASIDPAVSLTLSCAPECTYTSASGDFLADTTPVSTPEASSLLLLVTGLLGLGVMAFWRRSRAICRGLIQLT